MNLRTGPVPDAGGDELWQLRPVSSDFPDPSLMGAGNRHTRYRPPLWAGCPGTGW